MKKKFLEKEKTSYTGRRMGRHVKNIFPRYQKNQNDTQLILPNSFDIHTYENNQHTYELKNLYIPEKNKNFPILSIENKKFLYKNYKNKNFFKNIVKVKDFI